MLFDDFTTKRLRLFPLATGDVAMSNMPDLLSAFLLSLFIDRVGMNINQFSLEVIHPFQKYFRFLRNNVTSFPEEYLLFFMENYYHSSNYGVEMLKEIVPHLDQQGKKAAKVIVHSLKCEEEEARKIMEEHPSIVCFIRTDAEYFFNELLSKKTPLSAIPNVLYRDDVTGEIIITRAEEVTYDLQDYILGGYHNGHIFRLLKHPNYVVTLLNDDSEKTNDDYYYSVSRKKMAQRVRMGASRNMMMIATGRGCKYNCIYCYRGVKYATVRQISLDVLKKDLDALQDMGIEEIYIYDDCFLTTNADRLPEMASLLSSYPFRYQIAIRYEMCTPEVLDTIKDIHFSSVQIGLQSASQKTNVLMKRGINIDQFGKILNVFRDRKAHTMVDLILGLPGETLQDFLDTLKQALMLNPGNITVNTLFLNPGTDLYRNIEKYGIVAGEKKPCNVAQIFSSTTFPTADIEKAREILAKTAKKFPHINFVIR